MGIVKHKDLFSSKYNTAIVIDSNKRAHFIPIKFVINDFFMAKIQGLLYVFKIEDSRMMTYRETMVKACHFFIYDTDNWMPLDSADVTKLDEVLTKNNLGRVDRSMLKAFRMLARKEKTGKEEHDIELLAQEVAQHEQDYPDEVKEMLAFFETLSSKKIVTPVRKVTDFLVDDLIATNPQFMGSVVDKAIQAELLHKNVSNEPVTGKKPYLKMVAILLLIGIVGGLAYYAYSSGVFSHMIPQIGAPAPTTANDIMKQYPDPIQLKQAIADGKVKYADLPPDVQKLVDSTKLPEKPLAPNQH